MPSKYTIRFYVENGIYHVYNRGVDKRTIFEDTQDYKLFLSYLKRYLTEPTSEVGPHWKKGLHMQIELLAYCLMGNHFHLLVKQNSKTALTTFMRCLSNSYTKYFNQKYDRVGPLLQGKFKAILVDKDNYLLHLTRYIHLNPVSHKDQITSSDLARLEQYNYSSYADYIGKLKTKWVKPEFALGYFKESSKSGISYKDFVEDFVNASSSTDLLENYAIDAD